MQTRSVLCRAHVNGIRQAIESWQTGQDASPGKLDAEDLIQECLSTHDLLKGWYERACQSFRTGGLDGQLLSYGQLLRAVFGDFRDLLATTERLVAGNGEDLRKQLQTVAQSVASILADLDRCWPTVDHEMIAQSMAEFERGEFVTGEEALGDMSLDQSGKHGADDATHYST